jgi:hypothetical protein
MALRSRLAGAGSKTPQAAVKKAIVKFDIGKESKVSRNLKLLTDQAQSVIFLNYIIQLNI